METFTKEGATFLRFRAGASTFALRPDFGARLMSWDIAPPSGVRGVIRWPEDADDATGDRKAFASIRGGNPVLFPFAGRQHVGGIPGAWIDPEGIRRPYPQHGVARQGLFTVSAAGPEFVTARFLPDEVAREAYPYSYDFTVTYRFRELGFTVEFALENRDTRTMPWGPGHHFYFTMPWHQGLRRRDYTLNLNAKKAFRHAGDGSYTAAEDIGEFPLAFDHPGLSDTMFTKIKGDSLTFGPRNGEENIRVSFDSGAATTVVVWTQADDAPFYCVEPWACRPNAQAFKFDGVRMVPPGMTDRFTCKVGLE